MAALERYSPGSLADPGQRQLFLGQQAMQGERGVLTIPGDCLLRPRNNPFYAYEEMRILKWLE